VVLGEVCPESGGKGCPGALSREIPDVDPDWAFEDEADVSNGGSHGDFGFGMRGTLGGVKKQIPIPEMTML
jgi:hypothetical protein